MSLRLYRQRPPPDSWWGDLDLELGPFSLDAGCMEAEVYICFCQRFVPSLTYETVDCTNERAAPNGYLPTLLWQEEALEHKAGVMATLKSLLVCPTSAETWEGATQDNPNACTLEAMLLKVNGHLDGESDPQALAVAALCEQALKPYLLWKWWSDDGGMFPHTVEQQTWGTPKIQAHFVVNARRKQILEFLRQMDATDGARLKAEAEATYRSLEKLLQEQPFFAGQFPGAVDAKVFAHLVLHLCGPEEEDEGPRDGPGEARNRKHRLRLLDPSDYDGLMKYVRRCSAYINTTQLSMEEASVIGAPVVCRLPKETFTKPSSPKAPWAALSWRHRLKHMMPYIVGMSVLVGFLVWKDMGKASENAELAVKKQR